MPPRLLVAAIVIFWVSTTSWLFYREVWPRLRAGQVPPFAIDLTDEVGANVIAWKVLQNDERIGTGISLVKRHHDRTFELTSELKFTRMDIAVITVKKLTCSFHVTPDGALLGLEGKLRFRIKHKDDDVIAVPDNEAVVSALVEDGFLKPTVVLFDTKMTPQPIPFAQRGSIVNPMGMVNKIDGLQSGQAWTVPLLDFVSMILPGKGLSIPEVFAEATDDVFHWPVDEPVACYRIDYRKPGEDIVASTWVRRRDGVVLKQQARMQGKELTLVRENR